jgi:putative transposase
MIAEEKAKFTGQQIAFALKQAETGTGVDKVYRKRDISEATFYNLKKN